MILVKKNKPTMQNGIIVYSFFGGEWRLDKAWGSLGLLKRATTPANLAT
jgi:hypothetical protein